MRTVSYLLSTLAFGLIACGGSDSNNNNNNNNNDDTDGGLGAAVSSLTPTSAFLGRSLDVEISGNGTNWSSATTAKFGDGITVNKTTVASRAALIVNLTIAPTATLGARDVTVSDPAGDATFKGGFTIGSPIEVTTQGTLAQGSLAQVHVTNRDLTTLFDTTATGGDLFTAPTYTNFDVTVPAGTHVFNMTFTQFTLDFTIGIDVDAAPGNGALEILSGPVASQTHSLAPASLKVAAREATALGTSPAMGAALGYDSLLYTYTASAGNQVQSISVTNDMNSTTAAYLLGADGAITNIVDIGTALSELTTATGKYYIIVWDSAGAGGNATTAHTESATLLATESTSNETHGGAQVVTPPQTWVQAATLSSATDNDWYSIVVGGTGHKLHVQTLPGDAQTDTFVTIYASTDLNTAIATSSDTAYHENLTTAVLAAGTYFVNISASPQIQYSAAESHYDALFNIE